MAERVLLAEGREAEVFARPDGRVVKLMRDAGSGATVEREAAVCRLLVARGARAPAVVGTGTVDGRPRLVMERIDGGDPLAALERRPFLVFSAARTLAEAHLWTHEVVAPPELPDLHDDLDARDGAADRLPAELRDLAIDVLGRLPGATGCAMATSISATCSDRGRTRW